MVIISRLISSSRHLLRRNALTFKNDGEWRMAHHVASIPPRNKIPSGELFVMGAGLAFTMWFVPFWILYHIPDYQKEDRNTYTGK